MVDAAPGPPPVIAVAAGEWRKGLERWARELRAVYYRHPWILQIVAGRAPLEPGQLAWLEAGLQTLGGTRLDPGRRLSVILLIVNYLRGEAQVATGLVQSHQRTKRERREMQAWYGRMLARLIDDEALSRADGAVRRRRVRPGGRGSRGRLRFRPRAHPRRHRGIGMTEAAGVMKVADSHCHIDMPQFDADRDAVVARAREAGRRGHAARRRRGRGAGAPPRAAGGGGARPARLGRRPPARGAAGDRRHLRRAARAGAATSGSWPSARSASTSTTTTRRATCSARSSAPRSAWPARSALPVIIHTREADDETAALLEEEGAGAGGRHPLLHRRPRAGPARPRPRLLHLVLRDRRLPAGGGHPGGRAHGAPRPAAGGDGRARSWPRRRTAASATSPRSWSRSSRKVAAPARRAAGGDRRAPRSANFRRAVRACA